MNSCENTLLSSCRGAIKTVGVLTFLQPVYRWYVLAIRILFYLLIIMLTTDLVLLIIGTNDRISFLTNLFLAGAFDSLLSEDTIIERTNLVDFLCLIRQKTKKVFLSRTKLENSWIRISKTEKVLIKLSLSSEGVGRLFVLPAKLCFRLYTSKTVINFAKSVYKSVISRR